MTIAMWLHTFPRTLTFLLGKSLLLAGDPFTPSFIQSDNWNVISSGDQQTQFVLGETVILQLNQSLWDDFADTYNPSDDIENAELWLTDFPVFFPHNISSESCQKSSIQKYVLITLG